MSNHWPWAAAGVRRDPVARRQAAAKRRLQETRLAAARERNDEIAHRKWRAGLVVPHNITIALDAQGLVGPEVDAACRAEEPEVDLWEAGRLYPRWDQLQALAELTGKIPRWFTEPHRGVPVDMTSLRFHLPPSQVRALETPPVLRYPDEVVARCPGTDLADVPRLSSRVAEVARDQLSLFDV